MRFQILTLFPKIFESFASQSIIGRARENSRVQIEIFDLRDFSKNKHKKVDSPPFGGGAGMILQCEPVFRALEKINPNDTSPVIFFTPSKNTWNQKMAEMISRGTLPKRLDKSGRFAGKKIQNWILLCGHYGGIDQRILDVKVDAEISVGKFILTGGELPAQIFLDSVIRLLPNVLGNEQSTANESYSIAGNRDSIAAPEYTRPADFRGFLVPEILQSGHHQNIENWKKNARKKI